MNEMSITSSAFKNGETIPQKHTCDDNDVNPPFEISNIPEGTQSLALIVDDPDAVEVVGHVWDHWIVYNITADTTKISTDSIPQGGIEGMTSFEEPGYGGPCPPPGATHTYSFRVYALDAKIEDDTPLTKDALMEKMEDHILETAEIQGVYTRPASK